MVHEGRSVNGQGMPSHGSMGLSDQYSKRIAPPSHSKRHSLIQRTQCRRVVMWQKCPNGMTDRGKALPTSAASQETGVL